MKCPCCNSEQEANAAICPACSFPLAADIEKQRQFLQRKVIVAETEQSDIAKAGGGVFSFSLIILINMAVILGLAEIYFPGIIPLGALSGGIISRTIEFWKWFFDNLYELSLKFFA